MKIHVTAKRQPVLTQWEHIKDAQADHEDGLLDIFLDSHEKAAPGTQVAVNSPRHSIEDVMSRQGVRREGNGNKRTQVFYRR